MMPSKVRIQDIKTGKVREITEYAHKINKKHGFDKQYTILPSIQDMGKVEKIAESNPEPIPTYDPYTDEVTLDEFEEADIHTTDEYGYKVEEGSDNQIKKKKRGRKSKNANNE